MIVVINVFPLFIESTSYMTMPRSEGVTRSIRDDVFENGHI